MHEYILTCDNPLVIGEHRTKYYMIHPMAITKITRFIMRGNELKHI